MNEKTAPFRERRALIGQFVRASYVDCVWPGRGLGRGIVNLTGEAWPALIKTGTELQLQQVSSQLELRLVN